MLRRLALLIGAGVHGAAEPAPAAPAAGRVAVSLLAYHPSPWVDVLLKNLHKHTEPTTIIALHLNALTHYPAGDVRRWNASANVLVVPDRVAVQRAHGSILAAHVVNARAISRAWPDCAYVVLQASNMLWHRPGMESTVRALRHSVAEKRKGTVPARSRARHHPFWRFLYGQRGLDGSGQHEGAFFPLGVVLRFGAVLDGWLLNRTKSGRCGLWRNDTVPCADRRAHPAFRGVPGLGTSAAWDELLATPQFLEEYWLQAYALNVERLAPQPANAWLCTHVTGGLTGAAARALVAGGGTAAPACVAAFASLQSGNETRLGLDACGAARFAIKPVPRDPEDPLLKILGLMYRMRYISETEVQL